MYVDVETVKHNNSFGVSVYRDGVVERIISDNMNLVAEYIKNILSQNNQILYIDNRGFGLYLTDCLEQIGVSYIVLNNVSLNFNKIGEK